MARSRQRAGEIACLDRNRRGTTLRSIGQIARLQRIVDNDADYVTPGDMLAELRDDNQRLVSSMREAPDGFQHGDSKVLIGRLGTGRLSSPSPDA